MLLALSRRREGNFHRAGPWNNHCNHSVLNATKLCPVPPVTYGIRLSLISRAPSKHSLVLYMRDKIKSDLAFLSNPPGGRQGSTAPRLPLSRSASAFGGILCGTARLRLSFGRITQLTGGDSNACDAKNSLCDTIVAKQPNRKANFCFIGLSSGLAFWYSLSSQLDHHRRVLACMALKSQAGYMPGAGFNRFAGNVFISFLV